MAARRDVSAPRGKVVPIGAARSPKGAVILPHDVGHMAAQAELDDTLFPHYLLGRQLALEEVMREVLQSLSPTLRATIVSRLSFNADQAMDRFKDGISEPKDEAANCGYIATLIQQGM